QDPDVLQSFFTRHFAGPIGEDALGEVVHLGGELVDLFGGDFLAVAAPAANAAVTVGRVESEPALFAIGSPLRDVVLRLPFLRLCWRAGDDTGETAVPGFLQRGRNLVGAQAAEAAKGEAQLLSGSAARAFEAIMPGIVAPAATPAILSDASRKNSRRDCSPATRSRYLESLPF